MNITPMLAKVYNPDQAHFPYLAQPKLDGVRCIGTYDGLFTRTGKAIEGFTEIEAEVKALIHCNPEILAVDGELYCHSMKFDEISGIVRKKGKDPSKDRLYLSVFDYIPTPTSADTALIRSKVLDRAIDASLPNMLQVMHAEINNQQELDGFLGGIISQGYEGVMLRNPHGKYEQKRSSNLLKLKQFQDSEFEITDTLEGSGKETGLLIWQCKTAGGETFTVRPEGSYEQREALLAEARIEPGKFIGKPLTVRFQELTSKGIPRFPVAVGIRDYE